MTVYSLENGMLGVRSERPAINDPTIPRHGSQPPTYICIDTLEVFQDTGSAWLFIGTLGFPGVTSAGSGALTVAHTVTVGDQNAAVSPDFSTVYGSLNLYDTPGNAVDSDNVISISQTATLPISSSAPAALDVSRAGNIAAADYVQAVAQIRDLTASAQPVFQVLKQGATVLRVDGTGATAPHATLSGPGGTTATLALSKLAGQTGLFIACTDENNAPKVSIAVDGEIVTADDVLAPTGVIKGATVALYASGTGAPSSGAHSQGEFHADTAGALFYCIADGTPGTWKTVTLT